MFQKKYMGLLLVVSFVICLVMENSFFWGLFIGGGVALFNCEDA
jgi:hypothetical protein